MSLNYPCIGRRIKEARTASELSQAELAELTDTSPQYISQIENIRKKPSLETLVNIANALNISADQLLVDNLVHSENEYSLELQKLISGCTSYEMRIIIDVIAVVRRSLVENRWMIDQI